MSSSNLLAPLSPLGTPSSGLHRKTIDKRASFGTLAFHGLESEEESLARHLLKDMGQAHLFKGWEAEDAVALEKKRELLHQLQAMDSSITGGLKGYLERAKDLLAASAEGLNPLEGWVPVVPKGNVLEPGSQDFAALEEKGLPEVGSCCFVLVAGGLGERLGYSGIKLELPTELCTGTCFLELYCKQILALQARYGQGKQLPLAIMVSDDTKEGTERLLAANNDFGMAPGQVTLLKQEKVPALMDNEAHMALEDGDASHVQAKPHGHGDVHALLHSSGIADKWLAEGRRWVFLFQDTNSLALHALPSLLGTSMSLGLQVNSCSIPRKAKEAIGAICKLSHKSSGRCMTVNVEYNQIEALLKASGFQEGDVNDAKTGFSIFPGNINQLLFALPSYAEVLEKTGGVMAEFVNPKYKDAEKKAFKKPTRLECMMQDYPKALQSAQGVGFTSLPQWLCFSPVKNSLAEARTAPVPACAASGEADKYRVFARTLQLLGADVADAEPASRSGVTVSLGPAIVFEPSFALAKSEIAAKFTEPSKVHISSRSTLLIKGHGVTVESLKLDGALSIEACEGANVTVKDLTVSNEGWVFETLADGGASVKETLAMRGYALKQNAMSTYSADSPGDYILSDSGLVRQ